MTEGGEFDTAIVPVCETEIAAVSVRMLRSAKAQTAKKFWVCSECEAILGPT